MGAYGSMPIPDPLTYSSTTNEFGIPLGTRVFYSHPTYGDWWLRWVLLKDAVTYAAGQVLVMGTTYGWATNDIAGGSGMATLRFAGVALKAYATAEYGWILEEGYYPTVKTNGDDDIAQGDTVIIGAADGVVDSVAGATATGNLLYVGVAAAADVDSANTVAVSVKSAVW